jgi:hypothetical protein
MSSADVAGRVRALRAKARRARRPLSVEDLSAALAELRRRMVEKGMLSGPAFDELIPRGKTGAEKAAGGIDTWDQAPVAAVDQVRDRGLPKEASPTDKPVP